MYPLSGFPYLLVTGQEEKEKQPLLAMLQSCSTLAVVNIDAGFVAGAYAARIANMIAAAGREGRQKKIGHEE